MINEIKYRFFNTLNDKAMDNELLRVVAVHYFEDNVGSSPDTLKFIYEEHGTREFALEATLGERVFEIYMLPLHNRIELTEKMHSGSFAYAAVLAGMDTELNNLK